MLLFHSAHSGKLQRPICLHWSVSLMLLTNAVGKLVVAVAVAVAVAKMMVVVVVMMMMMTVEMLVMKLCL